MANNVIKRIWNQNKMVNIEALQGMAFQAEDGGHTFEISGVDDSGATVSLSGTVAGVFRRPDNADIALTGAASDGKVSVTLTEDCYAVPGRFGLTIFVTADSKKTAVYAAIGTVSSTSGGAVAGDTPQDVVDLINAINAAIATIPASYANIMAAIAPTYSNSALYGVGSYAWYDGTLYRCISAITTGESWNSSHWAPADISRIFSGQIGDISTETDNLFDINNIRLGFDYGGRPTSIRALGGDMYVALGYISVQAVSLPSNLKYEVDIYGTDDLGSHVGWYPDNWITDENAYTTMGVQSSNKHFRIIFASVNGNALTPSDFVGLKMQVNSGGSIRAYKPHLEAHDRTARELVASYQNDISAITEQTNNLFDKSAVIIGVNGQGATAAERAVSADIYSTDNIAVQAVSLPSNLKYEIDIYSSDSLSSRQLWYPSTWITDENTYTTYGLQSTYNHFRIHFASVDGNALTESDFDGLEMQVNVGPVIYKYKPHICSVDNKLIDEPVRLRIMEYNIGHYCYGQGVSFDDVGLPADQYDEKVLGMKRFFAKYQPDILGLCEFWEWLDNAKTHKSDDVLFDPIFPYKHQTTQWNAMKSNYILSNYSIGSLGGNGQQYVKADITVAGITVGLLLVHFGLTSASRATEIANAITLMQGYENAIIMGDFNTDTQSDRTAVFGAAESAGYTLANGGYFGWKNTWNYLTPDRPIDNIIFKGRIKLKDYQVLNDEVGDLCSDHIPTYADIVVF